MPGKARPWAPCLCGPSPANATRDSSKAGSRPWTWSPEHCQVSQMHCSPRLQMTGNSCWRHTVHLGPGCLVSCCPGQRVAPDPEGIDLWKDGCLRHHCPQAVGREVKPRLPTETGTRLKSSWRGSAMWPQCSQRSGPGPGACLPRQEAGNSSSVLSTKASTASLRWQSPESTHRNTGPWPCWTQTFHRDLQF